MWLLYRCANQDLELACDEETVERLERTCGPFAGRDYARTLLRMEERRGLSLFSSFSHPVPESSPGPLSVSVSRDRIQFEHQEPEPSN